MAPSVSASRSLFRLTAWNEELFSSRHHNTASHMLSDTSLRKKQGAFGGGRYSDSEW